MAKSAAIHFPANTLDERQLTEIDNAGPVKGSGPRSSLRRKSVFAILRLIQAA